MGGGGGGTHLGHFLSLALMCMCSHTVMFYTKGKSAAAEVWGGVMSKLQPCYVKSATDVLGGVTPNLQPTFQVCCQICSCFGRCDVNSAANVLGGVMSNLQLMFWEV